MSSERLKVIGVSKVNIPTLFHPEVPYFVLVLEDENGNKWVQKHAPYRTEGSGAGSVKEYKTGEEFVLEFSRNKNGVAIWRIKYDVLEGIEKVVELLGGIEVDQGSKILILPTLISPEHPHFAENTSPQFLGATMRYLIEKGVKIENVKVCGQSFDEIPISASAQKSQLLKVCQEFKVLPINLAEKKFLKKGDLEVSEEVFSADLILNLPILKIGKTLASENLFKLLKKENYLAQRYLSSDEEIFKKLIESRPKILTVAEADSVQKLDGFVAHLGLVLASFNSLNLDRIFFELTNFRDLPEILKEVKIENIPILGRKVEELQSEVEKY
jgi:uncharacterized protein (DUF362 family)